MVYVKLLMDAKKYVYSLLFNNSTTENSGTTRLLKYIRNCNLVEMLDRTVLRSPASD